VPSSNPSETHSAIEEVESSAGRRVYRIRLSGEALAVRVAERLGKIGATVRLPGFRPGKIPAAVLQQRYGAKARQEAIRGLAAEAADAVVARGALAASLDLVADAGDAVEFRLAATYLPELPAPDPAAMQLERLSAPQSALDALGLTSEAANELLDTRLRQQVLDHLHAQYRFPVASQLVARELAGIRRAAEEAMESDAATSAERAAIEAEFGEIAERRVRLGAVVAEIARRYKIEGRGGEREDALIGFLVSQAQVTDREATLEELREMAGGAEP
jgi:FKBP-type peptidyl-prolyl cis-trans isomerase (trigger factor)